jgi:hypothetical protein
LEIEVTSVVILTCRELALRIVCAQRKLIIVTCCLVTAGWEHAGLISATRKWIVVTSGYICTTREDAAAIITARRVIEVTRPDESTTRINA